MAYPSKISLVAITEAAVRVATSGGYRALGVRPVADALGVRPSALARYCRDYDGLVALVAEHAATALTAAATARLDRLTERTADSGYALLALADAYRVYAQTQPALYAALMTDTSRSAWTGQQGSARKALWGLLLQVVGDLTGDPDDTGAAVAVWSFLHGFADLAESGLFGESGPRDGFERGLGALVAGLRRGREIAE
jgi:AcrR family transcriptional regulator